MSRVGEPGSRIRAAVACLVSALASIFLLAVTLRFDQIDLRSPLNYLSDANIFLVRAKAIVEGNWVWWNPRLGMPFGSDWRDFPMNITTDSALMWVLSRFTSTPPLIVNLVWIIAIGAAAGLAAYAFLRVGFSASVSAAGGAIFALLPYIFFRGTNHLHSVYYAVPLVALAAIELVGGVWISEGEHRRAAGFFQPLRKVPFYAWIGCVLAGLAYVYTAFFAVFVLAAAGVIAFLKRRDLQVLILAAALAGAVIVTAAADLSPSLLYWARNGSNAAMLFKSPAEAELYALKIRYLVTPVPDHPIPWLRDVETRLEQAKYPLFVNENEWGRLGTIGSIGFLCLMIYALGAAVKPGFLSPEIARLWGPCAALTLACILFGTVGGFGDFFSTFVTPDIRCYARIFPFIGFFSVCAALLLWRPVERRASSLVGALALAAIVVLAAFDQAVPSFANDHKQDTYRRDDQFVRSIETMLPLNSMVFELPYTDFPNEILPASLGTNDLVRPYLHSSTYRWSWPAISGTTSAEWNRRVAHMPIPQMLRTIVHRGFSGIWLDSAGFTPATLPAAAIAAELNAVPRRDPNGRFLFFDLRAYASALAATEAAMSKPERLARDPMAPLFERGFYYEEGSGAQVWRWSLKRARITLVNDLDLPRKATLSLHMETADKQPHGMHVSWPGGSDVVQLPATYSRSLELAPAGRVALDFSCDCPAVDPPGAARKIYFVVSAVAVVE